MKQQPRLYAEILESNLKAHRQMAFISGPRQVGKTTLGKQLSDLDLHWENPEDQRLILGPVSVLLERLGAHKAAARLPRLLLDELHKYPRWKSWLKGFFDAHEDELRILVTGSARLDVYRRGGDSMMGRYFLYRVHPFSVGELLRSSPPKRPIQPPALLPENQFRALYQFGGFPEPLLKRNRAFSLRWQKLRREQLMREDMRDLSHVLQVHLIDAMVTLLEDRSARLLVHSNLAQTLQITTQTAQRWVQNLIQLHHGFMLRPWSKSVASSLRKECKWYLRDWSAVSDPGQRAETFVACHLLKAVEGWTDMGMGNFELYYLRNKKKQEVDFLVVRDSKPWFLAEAKKSEGPLSPALRAFQTELKAPHAFQVVLDAPYLDKDCFSYEKPISVPARTFLSQLL
jgi:predicted AAA+ superfamily ATPase